VTDVYFASSCPVQSVLMHEDTAGNKWYAEFVYGSTAPTRTWVERAEAPVLGAVVWPDVRIAG